MASRAAQRPPSQQATQALADAVRRARAAHGEEAPAEITEPVPVVRPASAQPPAPARPAGRARTGSSPRWLVRGIAAVAVLAVLLGAADLALLLGNRHPSPAPGHGAAVPTLLPAPSTTAKPAPGTTKPRTSSTIPTTTRPSTTASTSTTTTSTTTPPARAGGAPRLASITPARGRPGTVVLLQGSGFISPRTGVVVAHVGGQAAPTRCPAPTSCEVTIPQLGRGRRTVSVTITTDAGTSNALRFRYI